MRTLADLDPADWPYTHAFAHQYRQGTFTDGWFSAVHHPTAHRRSPLAVEAGRTAGRSRCLNDQGTLALAAEYADGHAPRWSDGTAHYQCFLYGALCGWMDVQPHARYEDLRTCIRLDAFRLVHPLVAARYMLDVHGKAAAKHVDLLCATPHATGVTLAQRILAAMPQAEYTSGRLGQPGTIGRNAFDPIQGLFNSYPLSPQT